MVDGRCPGVCRWAAPRQRAGAAVGVCARQQCTARANTPPKLVACHTPHTSSPPPWRAHSTRPNLTCTPGACCWRARARQTATQKSLIYALASDAQHGPFVPTEVHLITTREGAQRAEAAAQ